MPNNHEVDFREPATGPQLLVGAGIQPRSGKAVPWNELALGSESANVQAPHRGLVQLRRHPDGGVRGAIAVVSAAALDDLEE